MLRNLISLNSLQLDGRMIHGTAAREWSSLTALTSLEQGFGVTDDGARAVGTLTTLTSQGIIECCVLSTVDAVNNLHALVTLSLSDCTALSDVSCVSSCTALKTLDLSGCRN